MTVCSGNSSGPVAQRLAGGGRVLGRHEVRMGSRRPGLRQLQHLRSEGRQHPPVDGHRLCGVVQSVEERPRRREWLAVATGLLGVDERRVADADAQQEPVAVVGGQLCVRMRDLGWLVHPEVEDAGGDHGPSGAAQQVSHRVEHLTADVGDPQRRVPEFFEFRRRFGRLGPVAIAQLRTPYPNTRQFHAPDGNVILRL